MKKLKLKKKNIIIISCLVLVAVLVAGYFTYKRMGITMNKVHLVCDDKEGHETTLNFELDFSKSKAGIDFDKMDKQMAIDMMREEMLLSADKMEFEYAAKLRDEIATLE